MIEAVRKVIAAYHDAPEAVCMHCWRGIEDALYVDKGLHGILGLAEAIQDLEEILGVVDHITATQRAGVPFEG